MSWVVLGTGLVRPLKQVSAERFVVKDGKGQVRAGLSLKIDGSPELAMFDGGGRRLVSLQTAADDSGSLQFFDHDDLRVSMGSTPGGPSVLNFMDRRGASTMGFYLWPDNSTGLGFSGGGRNVQMRIGPDGASRLSFTDRNGGEIAGVGVPPPRPSLAGAGAGGVPEPASNPRVQRPMRVRPIPAGKDPA